MDQNDFNSKGGLESNFSGLPMRINFESRDEGVC